MITFQGRVKQDKDGVIYIQLPFDAGKKYNQPAGAISVYGTVNKFPYRLHLLEKEKGMYFLVLSKEIQDKLGYMGKEINVEVIIEQDMGIVDVEKETVQKKSTVDVLTAISKRRSIRKFQKESLSKADIKTIINAAFCAPSAHNRRPWYFIVVTKKGKLKKIAEVSPYAKMVKDCAAAIIVCGDIAVQKREELLYVDCAAAIQNILLSSYGLGIGSVWTAVLKDSDIQKWIMETYQLADNMVPMAVIALGYPAEEKADTDRFEAQKVRYD